MAASAAPFRYFVGVHQPEWLWKPGPQFPMCVSRRRLAKRKTLGRAQQPWILDSGGYTELSMYGRWTITARQYVQEVARYATEIGQLQWAAPMDHMCEPWVINGGWGTKCPGTGLDVETHQWLTVENYLLLVELWKVYGSGPCPFIPVVQGWTAGQYGRCIEKYAECSVDLFSLPTVGVGTVCRRTSILSISRVIDELAGLKVHGFGVKISGLKLFGQQLVSADSMAWSFDAVHNEPLPGHRDRHKHCNNCREYAADWYADLPLHKLGCAA